jgi:Uma2 family endonuclease
VFVAADHFWCPIKGDNRTRTGPDVMAVFGRPPGHRRSYLPWREGDVVPQVIFEILSPSNSPLAMLDKLNGHDRFGVREYYVFDPDSSELRGWDRPAISP